MSRDNVKKVKPSQDLACKCIAAITDAVAEKFGYKYITIDSDRGKWFRLLPYEADVEQIAVAAAADALLTQTNSCSDHKNPEFIEQVLRKVAVSLAQYAVRNPVYKMDEIIAMPDKTVAEQKQKKQARREAYESAEANTFNRLRNETVYLRHLEEKCKAHKAEEKIKRKMGPAAYNMKKAKQIRAAKACVDHRCKKDIQDMFKESEGYRRKRK